MNNKAVTIGILTYNSNKYIHYCLPSLLKQNYSNLKIIILDNNSTDNTVAEIKKTYPEITIIQNKKNIGFGAGHNQLIRQINDPYYLCLNIDMIFEPNFVLELVKIMDKYPNAASLTGKLFKWNFNKNKKTNYIDSIGLKITAEQKFLDIEQGKINTNKDQTEQEIFGCSGAAVMFRKSALEKVKIMTQNHIHFFDERMFMYKEDLDLAYRLRWGNFSSFYVPQAIAYHDRTATAGKLFNRRQEKSLFIRKNSLINQLIMEHDNFSDKFSWKTKCAFMKNKILRWIFIHTMERELIPCYAESKQIMNKHHIKKTLKIASPQNIEKWFYKK